MINLSKNWKDTNLENPIKKKDMVILAFLFVCGVVLAVSSNKPTSYMFVLLVAYCVYFIIGYSHSKDYKKHKFFIAKMQETANLTKNT